MSIRNNLGFFSLQEEIPNSISHAIGAILSGIGLVFLILLAKSQGTVWHVVSFSIFGAALVLLYSFSSLYHGVQNIALKRILRRIDQSAVFVLIAGSYTPFLLNNLRGPWGWSLFGVIWGLAIFGIISRFFAGETVKKGGLLIYLGMGWLLIIALKPMLEMVPSNSLLWLAAGGLAYSVGVVFYIWEKMPYSHTVWHLFVLLGSVSHYFAVINLV